jgi:hypothetical protein
MFLVLYRAIRGMTSGKSYLRSLTPAFQCLDLDGGEAQEWLEVDRKKLLGASWMPNTLEWPNAAAVCSLSSILEQDVPQKYYLSARACAGILRRAEKRGKQLPDMLKQALLLQSTAGTARE